MIFPYTYPGSLSLSLSFYITLLMPILILIKWPYDLLLIDYLKVSPYLFPKLMSINKNVFSPLYHGPTVDVCGNKLQVLQVTSLLFVRCTKRHRVRLGTGILMTRRRPNLP